MLEREKDNLNALFNSLFLNSKFWYCIFSFRAAILY